MYVTTYGVLSDIIVLIHLLFIVLLFYISCYFRAIVVFKSMILITVNKYTSYVVIADFKCMLIPYVSYTIQATLLNPHV